jgi:transcription elongation factor GreA
LFPKCFNGCIRTTSLSRCSIGCILKITMTNGETEYFSKEGLAKAKEELATLKTTTRKEIAGRLEYAKSLGDLSENSEYQEAKEAQVMNEQKIIEMEDVLRRATVVEKGAPSATVEVGSQVVVEPEDQPGAHATFTIVGSRESSPEEQKISNESPLGKALLKHKKSDTVSVTMPRGKINYKIIDIF